MKSQFLSFSWARANGPSLALAIGLAITAVGQLMLTHRSDERNATVAIITKNAPAQAAIPSVEPIEVPSILLRRNVFVTEPGIGEAADGTAPPPPPLGGVRVAGSAQVGGRAYGVIQLPNGTLRRLAVGGRLNGWRLDELTETSALFVRGRERLEMAFGTEPPATTEDDEERESGL